jgi:hypothetical protein
MNHVAEHELADLLRLDLGALDRFPDHLRGQFGRRHVFECAAVIADCRPYAAQYHHFASAAHVILLSPLI